MTRTLCNNSGRSPRASSRNQTGNHWVRRLTDIKESEAETDCPHVEAETAGWRQRVSTHPPAALDWQLGVFKSEMVCFQVFIPGSRRAKLRNAWGLLELTSPRWRDYKKTRSTWNRCQRFQRWEEVIIMKLRKAVSWMWIMHVGGLWVLILSSVRISSTVLFQKF